MKPWLTVIVATYGRNGDETWRLRGDQAAETAEQPGTTVIRNHLVADLDIGAGMTEWGGIPIPNDDRLARTRNDALAKVETDWTVFLDGDDSLAPDFAQQVSETLGGADVIQPAVAGWGLGGVPICRTQHDGMLASEHVIMPRGECLAYGNPLSVSAIARTSLLWQVGGFDPRWPQFEDFALWRTLAVAGARFDAAPTAVYMARSRGNWSPRNRALTRQARDAVHDAIIDAIPWPQTRDNASAE